MERKEDDGDENDSFGVNVRASERIFGSIGRCMHVELYVHTRDHGEWGLCVVARTRPNLGGYGAARAPNGPAPYNKHFLLPDALHGTSSERRTGIAL